MTTWIDVCVARKEEEADGIFGFDLVSASGAELPAFEAGSHIDLKLPNGVTRQYSICNSPIERGRYQIALQREQGGRGGSVNLCDTVKVGDTLSISVPRNRFALTFAARRSILFAGGIGITPILAMAEALHTNGAEFTLHYTARTRSRMAFEQRLANAPFKANVIFHFDDEAATRLDVVAAIDPPQADTHIYVCGPKGFIDAVMNTARDAGWPPSQLHFELFTAEIEKRADDGSFYVELAKSGRRVLIPADKSVAETLSAEGVEVEVSCEQGICGTCITRVLAGEPDHRDLFMSDEEHAQNDRFTPCCSRSKSPVLVIDR